MTYRKDIKLNKLIADFEFELKLVTKKYIKKIDNFIQKRIYLQDLEEIEKKYLIKIKNLERIHSIKMKQISNYFSKDEI